MLFRSNSRLNVPLSYSMALTRLLLFLRINDIASNNSVAMEKEIREILTENDRRIKERSKVFNPITGEGCPLARAKLEISDYQVPVQFVPKDMLKNPLIKSLSESGSMKSFLKDLGISSPSKEDMEKLALQILYLRCKYDFVFTAANLQYIKPKGGGDVIRV